MTQKFTSKNVFRLFNQNWKNITSTIQKEQLLHKDTEEELLHKDFIDTLNSEQKEKLIIYFGTLIEGLQRKINTDKHTKDIELIYNERKLFYTNMLQYVEMQQPIDKPYGKRIFSLIINNKLIYHI